jgi:hypothetical protein
MPWATKALEAQRDDTLATIAEEIDETADDRDDSEDARLLWEENELSEPALPAELANENAENADDVLLSDDPLTVEDSELALDREVWELLLSSLLRDDAELNWEETELNCDDTELCALDRLDELSDDDESAEDSDDVLLSEDLLKTEEDCELRLDERDDALLPVLNCDDTELPCEDRELWELVLLAELTEEADEALLRED